MKRVLAVAASVAAVACAVQSEPEVSVASAPLVVGPAYRLAGNNEELTGAYAGGPDGGFLLAFAGAPGKLEGHRLDSRGAPLDAGPLILGVGCQAGCVGSTYSPMSALDGGGFVIARNYAGYAPDGSDAYTIEFIKLSS